MEKLFAVTSPGLEPFTAQELIRLGVRPVDVKGAFVKDRSQRKGLGDEGGGISFEGDLETIYRSNLHLRTASRVLVRLGDFYAAAFSELRKKASRLVWERYLRPGQPVAIRVTCHKSRLYHSDAVAERIAGAIQDRLGRPVQIHKHEEKGDGQLPQLVLARLVHDDCTISIDSSGVLLHRRGYRLATAKAPLRETLAAGMILAAGWDGSAPLLDPFCGSGTIPIEAAQMALGIPPGSKRRFAFMEWPAFDSRLWSDLLAENRMPPAGQSVRMITSDRDAGAVEMAKANAERAGVGDCIEFSCRAVSAIEPGERGWIVTNPPYGLRVSADKDVRNLYAQFGKVLRAKCQGWPVAILCSDVQLLRQTGLHLDTSLSLFNGGVAVRLGRGVVEAQRSSVPK
ncbi:MAG: class I SAM-dependent RNA methyltransferase [Chloroflexota bacterium]